MYASTQWSEFEWGHGMQLKCPALSELPQHIVQFWKKKKKRKVPRGAAATLLISSPERLNAFGGAETTWATRVWFSTAAVVIQCSATQEQPCCAWYLHWGKYCTKWRFKWLSLQWCLRPEVWWCEALPWHVTPVEQGTHFFWLWGLSDYSIIWDTIPSHVSKLSEICFTNAVQVT